MVKFLGKYFFKSLNDEEYEHACKHNIGVREDIKTEEEAIQFALKLKMLPGKDLNGSTVYCWYFPSWNNDTESAIMVLGHHSHQDGISQMQSFFKVSDCPEKAEYPFFKMKAPTFL